jgi:uncharacterized protein (TIGR00661 family)
MARILYGVAGEGRGHASRSAVVLKHLKKKHKVMIVGGGKAYDHLKGPFRDVRKIHALRLAYKKNKVHYQTAINAIKDFPLGRKNSLQVLSEIFDDFKPELVISDFEYFSALMARRHGIPLISLDNNHIIAKTRIDVPTREIDNYLAARLAVNSIVRGASDYIICTFFYPKPLSSNVHLVPPIVNPNVERKRKESKHVFVYQTSDSNRDLERMLRSIEQDFIVYGFDRNETVGNVTFRGFNRTKFDLDLSSSRAVITNGGFSLMSEALVLGKPILANPIGRHFEQFCNAHYLEKLGYGENHRDLSSAAILGFLKRLGTYKKNLESLTWDKNKEVFEKLDALITLRL